MLGQIAAGVETSVAFSPSLGPWRLAGIVSVHEKKIRALLSIRGVFAGAAARVRSGWLHFTLHGLPRIEHAAPITGLSPPVTAAKRASAAVMCRGSGPGRPGSGAHLTLRADWHHIGDMNDGLTAVERPGAPGPHLDYRSARHGFLALCEPRRAWQQVLHRQCPQGTPCGHCPSWGDQA